MGDCKRGDRGGRDFGHRFSGLATIVLAVLGSVAVAQPGRSPERIVGRSAVGVDIVVHYEVTSIVVGETSPIIISLEAQPGVTSMGIAAITFNFVAEPALSLVEFEWLGELGDQIRYFNTVELPAPETVEFSGILGTGVPLPESVLVPVARLTVAGLQPVPSALLETNIVVFDDLFLQKVVVAGGTTALKIGCSSTEASGDDCNGNGVPDFCDIAGGVSGDCNNNGIPDECDIADGTSEDVEPQGMPDGIPDECIEWTGFGQDDFWSNGENWQGDSPPKNGGGEQFNVVLEGTQTNVILDLDVLIDSLQLLSGASLSLALGDLTIESPSGVLNDGELIVDDGRSFLAGAAFDLSGSGETRLTGPTSAMSSTEPNHTITNTSTIMGQGMLDAAFTNLGLLVANVDGGTLSVEGSFAKTNDGVLEARDGGTLAISAPIVDGIGSYRADGGIIRVVGDTNETQTATTNTIRGTVLEVVNGAEFLVEGDVEIIISGVVTIDSGGTYRADPERTDATSASLTAETIVIGSDAASGHGWMSLEDGMSMATSANVIFRVAAECTLPLRGGCTPPRLTMTGGAGAVVGGDLSIETSANITVDDSSSSAVVSFVLSGDFINQSTNPTIFNWDHGPLTLNGISQTFEVAGEERGPTMMGFDTNFAMDEVTVDADAEVIFRDAFDNHDTNVGPCTEALYVRHLILDDASAVTIDDCRVYYQHLTGDADMATRLGCGALLQVPTGDFDGNGVVDLTDYGALAACVADSEPNALAPGCGAFDLHVDGTLDVTDFGGFQLVFDVAR